MIPSPSLATALAAPDGAWRPALPRPVGTGAWTRERHGDIDEQAAALDGWHQRYLQLSCGRFVGEVQRLQLDGIGLFIEDLQQSVHQTGWVRPEVVALGVPLALEGDARFCGQPDAVDALHVFSGADGFEFRSPQRHVMIGIEVDRALFDAHVDTEPAHRPGGGRLTDRAHLQAADPAAMGALRGFLLDLFRCASRQDGAAAGPDAAVEAQLQRQVRTQLLDRIAAVLQPRAVAGGLARGGASAAQAALVARATTQVADRLGEPPSVAELCAALGVSRRTLQSAFQACWGMGPLAWLTTLRLDAVRRELKRAGSVTEAATQYGFWHFGHFADDYRALFGELPSQTLRRHRGGPH
jgi:AraC family ethanolamine operon transcriptional activator